MKHCRLLLCLFGLISAPSAFAQSDPGSYWLHSAGLNPWEWDLDHDFDNRTAREEYFAGTNPFDSDSSFDVDWIFDDTLEKLSVTWSSVLGAEYRVMDTPSLELSFQELKLYSGDGLLQEDEFSTAGKDRHFYRMEVLQPIDTDGDGLSAIEEAMLGTNPNLKDTDMDGFDDLDEVCVYFTDPLVPNSPGGTIRGTVLNDPNGDGDLTDGMNLEGVTVYLDANFNGEKDSNERTAVTTASGDYEFLAVQAGVHHVRQELPAPNVQTFPVDGIFPVYDMLPDEVTNYTHAAAGVGWADVPYGETASDWPADWGLIDQGATVDLVPSVDLVLKPIGVRNLVPGLLTYNGTEFVTMPMGAHITVRFDEVIVDLPGPDFLVHSIGGVADGEMIEILIGPDEMSLTSVGIHPQSDGAIAIDLKDYDLPGPIQFIKCISQDNGGGWPGFELVGFEALNIAPPDPGVHVVVITAAEVEEDKDFGRYFRDLPPTVILSALDEPGSPSGLRVGETMRARVNAFDDIGLSNLTLTANGQALSLDANNEASIPLANAGTVLIEARATDTGGQITEDTLLSYVLNADGSLPFDPNQIGRNESAANAPKVRLLSPGPGTVSDVDVPLIGEIIGTPEPTSWTVEYAPVDDVDPNNLTATDADYVQLASGSGNVYSESLGTLPLSTLPDGIYFVRVCAQNSPTQVACFGQVIAKNVVEADLRPQVTLSSPEPNAEVMLTTDIVGTITSARTLTEWYVEYARADQVDLNNLNADDPDWKRLASGSDQIPVDSVLATFDGTMMKNNGYVVRVVAWNDIGLGWAEPVALNVVGEAKLGRNRLEFTDLSIDVAGFPLTFTRVYDSLQAEEDGELGFGWSLQLQDPDIRETVPTTGSFGLFGATPFRDGTRVYITAPTGERLGFTFKPEVAAGSAFGATYRATFEPDPGVYHQLEIPEGDLGFLDLKESGEVFLFFFNLPYNPQQFVLIEPNGNRYTYHEDKGFLQAEDPNGNRLTLNPAGLNHSSGVGLTFTRDGQERITQITGPAGRVWSYTYDGDGNLATVTDPENHTTTYTYHSDPAHYLDTISDPLGRMPVRYEYDPVSGRLTAMIDAAGNRNEVTWDPAGFTGSTTDRRGNVTQIEYDARGNVTREIDPKGTETQWEYEDPNNPDLSTKVTDDEGNAWTSEYDAKGNLTAFVPPLSTFGNNLVRVTYDDFGNVTSYRGLDGSVITATYDDKGNLLTQASEVAPSLNLTRTATGAIASMRTGASHHLSFEYDGNGFPSGLQDSLGYEVGFTTNKAGVGTGVVDSGGRQYGYEFDSAGIPLEQEDPNGKASTVVENVDGSYTRTDRNGNTSTQMFDEVGNLVSSTLPGGGEVTASYDEEDNLKTVTDPGGNTTTFTYDSVNLISAITDAAGNALSRDYDAFGNVTEIVDRNGKKRTFLYDGNGRLTNERWHDATDAIIREFVFTHDPLRGLQVITETAGSETTTIRVTGRLPRPQRMTYEFPGQTSFNVLTNWSESPAPTVIAVYKGFAFVAQSVATYHANRLMSVRLQRPGQTGNTVELRYNPDGSVSTIDRYSAINGPLHSKSLYTYDSLGQMQSIRHEDGSGALIHANAELTYTRDDGARITGVSHAGDSLTLTYDVMDQLVAASHTDPSHADETYTYDMNGNRTSSHLLTTSATITTGNRLTAIGDFTFLLDSEGNMIRRTNTVSNEETNFVYDHRNRLVEATVHPSNGAAATGVYRFGYDYQDRLISREINGSKTWILNHGDMPVAEFADGASDINAMFLSLPDRTDDIQMVWRDGEGERWLMKDHLGSVRGTLDETGNTVAWVDYDAFGNLLGAAPAGIDTLRFAGRFQVEGLGLYENRRRFYDPVLGRFTQEDPLGLSGGDFNLYRYVGNNPFNLTDPQGTQAAVSYGMLANLSAFYFKGLCNYGVCLGNLWKGVVEASVNLTPPTLPKKECTIDMLGVEDPGSLGGVAAAGGKGAAKMFAFKKFPTLGNVAKVKLAAEACGKLKALASGGGL